MLPLWFNLLHEGYLCRKIEQSCYGCIFVAHAQGAKHAHKLAPLAALEVMFYVCSASSADFTFFSFNQAS